MDTDNLTTEAEEALERLLKDARNSARDFNPQLHRGRLLDEIDEDVATVRSALNIEI